MRETRIILELLAGLFMIVQRFAVKTAKREITHIASPRKKNICRFSMCLLYPEPRSLYLLW